MSILIATPIFIENEELLNVVINCASSYPTNIPKLAVVNSIKEEYMWVLKFFDFVIFRKKNIVAGAWNDAVDFARDRYNRVLILNQDVKLLDDEVFNYINQDPSMIGSIRPGEAYSAFFINPFLVDMLEQKEQLTLEPFPGRFDENIKPAYYEDNDFEIRLKRASIYRSNTGFFDTTHVGSAVIKSDNRLRTANDKTFVLNKNYYIRKWGGEPGQEKYILPFNNKSDGIEIYTTRG